MDKDCMIEKKAFKLADLASLTDGILVGDPQHEITGIADLQTATIREVSFLSNSRYLQSMKQSQAGAIIIDEKAPRLPEKNYIITQNPSKAFQALIDFFYPPRSSPSRRRLATGSAFGYCHPPTMCKKTSGTG